MSTPYYYWKFRSALEALAAGDGLPKQRIFWALSSLAGMLEQDLPPAVREVYLELEAHVTWKQDGPEEDGLWMNTLREMSAEDARKVAGLFIQIFEKAIRQFDDDGFDDG